MRLLLSLSMIAGFVLRFIWGMDMEFKDDEEIMFNFTQDVGVSEPWPWLGMTSGVYLHNPPLSVWVFVVLAKLFRIDDPVDLARVVQGLDWLAIALVIPFARYLIPQSEREPWYWAAAFASINPFAVLYQRKIWAQSILPIFSLIFLVGWLKRGSALGALIFGGVGIVLGQIHMSGFFFFTAFVIWAALFDRTSVRWRWFATGSAVGVIPMIPWLVYFLTTPRDEPIVAGVDSGLSEAVQLKYWVFWITDSVGLHLGNSLKGHLWEVLSNPWVATFHLAALSISLAVLIPGIIRFLRLRTRNPSSPTAFTLGAAFWGYGILMTLATVAIRRYYLIITFPLEWVWLGSVGLKRRKMLLGLWMAQFLISAAFLLYIHSHGGAPEGDYGVSYRHQVRSKILSPDR